ncbi:MAG: transporter [Prevotellaceae bacterium]|jgi:BASS family bile acid:Na+ symporter|nr:transporter [Prevotellaceae bacterium]
MFWGFIKKYTLPIAMVVGIAGYKWLGALNGLTPFLVFLMLLFTFSKISFNNLKPTMLHLWLLLIEIGFAVAVYYLLLPFNRIVAQGAMVCVICPTATAAAVITKKLGGKIEFVASYTLFANIVVAVAVPFLFPLMSDRGSNVTFLSFFLKILSKIFPLLICPFLLAFCIKKYMPKTQKFISEKSDIAFYFWAIALIIVIAQIVKSLIEDNYGGKIEILLAVSALAVCLLQFFLGKLIGKKYGQKIPAGQSLGQKNTVLAIWMAQTYLNPISAVAPGAYVLWQNIINSWQLYRKNRGN